MFVFGHIYTLHDGICPDSWLCLDLILTPCHFNIYIILRWKFPCCTYFIDLYCGSCPHCLRAGSPLSPYFAMYLLWAAVITIVVFLHICDKLRHHWALCSSWCDTFTEQFDFRFISLSSHTIHPTFFLWFPALLSTGANWLYIYFFCFYTYSTLFVTHGLVFSFLVFY